MAFGVVATRTVVRCKLCSHPQRSAIDQLLLRRSDGESDEEGDRINLAYVRAKLAEWGVPNPTEENVKNHWQKHCEKVSQEVAVRNEEKAVEVIEKVKSGDTSDLMTPDQFLDFVIAQSGAEAAMRIEADGKANITIDQGLKAIEVKTRRKADDGVNKLLTEVGKGIAGAMLKRALPDGPPAADLELEGTEVE